MRSIHPFDNRLNVRTCDGKTAIFIKQGGLGDVIFVLALTALCIFQGFDHLYFAGKFQGTGPTPVSDVVKFYGWLFLAFLTLLFALWYAMAYEIIEIRDGNLLVEIRIGPHQCLNRRSYPLADIKNLQLLRQASPKSGSKYWNVCFDVKNRRRQMESRWHTKDDGKRFINEYLKPMMDAEIPGTRTGNAAVPIRSH